MTTTPRAMISAVVGLSLTTLLLVAAGSGQQPAPQQTIDLVAGGDVQNVPASSIGLFDPLALALDAQGNLVISDCTRIYKVNLASGILTTIAGNGGACGTKLYGDPGNGGPAVAASVNGATGLAVDSAGDVIFTDQGSNEVREINASTGVVTAIAGTGVAGYSGDGGPATQAELNQPVGLAMDASGNLYFADDAGSGYIRKITQATGIISTVAAVPHPLALALDGVGHLYVSSQTGTLSQITLTSGLVAVIAGGGATPPATGVAAASANFGFMRGGVYADATGNVYFGGAYLGSTYSVSALWKIDAGSTVLTLMAGGGSSFSPTGPAAASRFDTLQGIAPDASGDLILASNSYVLKLDPSGNLSPLAGDGVAAQESSGNNLPELSSMITPAGVDGTGYGFAADAGGNRILAFGKGTETVFAGTGQPGYTGDGGPAVNAQLSYPQDVMTNSNGEMFIADSGNGVVRAVDQSTGIISTYAQGLAFPEGIALDAQGDLYIADTGNNEVKRVDAITHVVAIVAGDGTRDPTGTTGDGGLATNAELHFPQAVAVDNSGNLYITDHNLGYGYQGNPIADGTVRRVDAQTGIITTVAGVGDPGGNPPSTAVGSGDGGPATEAGLSDPDGIAVDANGNLYIADLGAAKVREVLASTGDIYTLAGNGQGGASGDGGPAVQAEFRPCGIRLDAGGNLWITDCDAGRLWELNNAVGAPVVSGRTDFPPQLVGTSSTPVAVTITNPGLAPITISGISPATGSSPDFTETNNCGTLTTGQTCTVNVTFTPSQLGFESGSFSINNNVSVAQVQAYGLGGSPAAPTVGTTSLTFATQAAGTTSAGQTVVLTDSGSTALPLTGLSIQTSGAFAETSDCGTTLPGGGSCSIVAFYMPTAAGGSTGALTITDTASGLTETVALNGTGSAAATPAPQQTIRLVAGGDVQNAPASSIGLLDPLALALDAQGNLIVSDCSRIYKVNLASGNLNTIAGNGEGCETGFYGDPGNGGPALAASVNSAGGLVIDSAGDIIFADIGSNEVREISASTGVVTAIAGDGVAGYSGDGGPATAAELNQPFGLAMDANGNLYIADIGDGRIRKITQATGVVSTVATVPSARELSLDGSGHLYVSSGGGTLSRVTLASGAVAVITGGGATAPANGVPAASAKFYSMRGVYADAAGDVYFGGETIGTSGLSALWEIAAGSPNLTLVAGGGSSFSPTGLATSTKLDGSAGAILPDGSGDLLFANSGYILKLDPGGNLSPVVGDGVGGQESSGSNLPELSSMITPSGVDGYADVADGDGDRIWSIRGTDRAVAGTGQRGYTGDGGPAVNAELSFPSDVVTNSSGEMFIADAENGVIRAVDPSTGIISTYAQGLSFPEGIALDAQGDLYIADSGNNEVKRVDAITHVVAIVAGDGTRDPTGTTGDGGLATSAELQYPQAVAVDNSGNLYITDQNVGYGYQGDPIADGTVRRVDAQTGIITTVAGVGDPGGNLPTVAVGSGDGGPATEAGLSDPYGIAVDAAGNLYIADYGAAKVREVLASTGDIYTLAGNGQGGVSGDGGPAVQAEFRPCGIRLDAGGNLWIADCDAGRLWVLNNAVGAPVVSGSPNLPPQLVGTSSTPVAVTITNPGLAPITISGVSPATGSSPDFTETNNCGILTTGQTCTVNITFSPSQPGFESGSFSINNSVSATTIALGGQGEGPAVPTVGANSLTFASQAVGTTSPGQTVVLSDGGSNALPLAGVSVQASGAFAETDNCGTTVAGGDNCSIIVTYAPVAAGGATGALTITDTASGLTETVALTGTGVAAASAVAMYPTALQFTNQAQGATSAAQAVLLSNTGSAPLAISGIAADGDFTEANDCGASLAPGAICGISVTFTPSAAGDRTGTLTVTDNAGDSPETVALSGAGAVSPPVITTIAGGGVRNLPATSTAVGLSEALAYDAAGNLFAGTEFRQVLKVSPNGLASLFAGNGVNADTGDGGPAVAAGIGDIRALAVDPKGDVFISASGVVREVTPDGKITTYAGVFGKIGFSGDGGPAAQAMLDDPSGLAVDAAGDLFIADYENQRVREVNASTGVITTFAGDGQNISANSSFGDGPTTSTPIGYPQGISVDQAGDVFIYANDYVGALEVPAGSPDIIATSQFLSPLMASDAAGSLYNAFSTDFRGGGNVGGEVLGGNYDPGSPSGYQFQAGGGNTPLPTALGGPATAAFFNRVTAISVSAGGVVTFAADNYILRVDSSGNLQALAGNGSASDSLDASPALDNSFFGYDLARDAAGNLYIADASGLRVRELVVATGDLITVAGNGTFPSSGPGGGDGGPATQAQVSPRGLAFDAVGNLYISDPAAVREVNAQTGVISTVAGTGTVGTAGDGGPATQAQLGSPEGLALDGQGDIFIADGGTFGTRNKPIARIARVREVSAGTGVISTVAGGGTNGLGDGGPAVDAALILPQGLAFDAAGNLYITDEGDLISPSDGSSRVREVNAQTSVITTVAGGGAGPGSGDGGPASQATLQLANRVLVDPAGNLFIADELGYAVRRVDAASGDITTVAGTGVYDVSGDGGSATSAAIGAPYGLTLNGAGDLFILADGRIRKVANAAGLPFLAPASLDFGAQPAGSTSTSESLVLTNPSSSPFAISSITAGAGFAETNTCGSALAAGATCSISVTFTPAAVGAASGSLTVTPGSGNPLKASLSGTGSSGVDTVTLQPVANQTLPVTSAIQLQATGLSTGAITYSATGPATVSGNQLTVTGVGTVTVTAMQAADANYNAGTASVSFTVSKGTQTITFAALANHLTTDAGFTFAATSSSGLSVSFTVLSGPATLNGSTVTLTGNVGLVAIQAAQAGNGTYAAAAPVTETFLVTAPGAAASALTLSATALSFGSQAVGTSSAAQTIVLTASGTGAVTISNVAASGDFSAATACAALSAGASCSVNVTFTPTTSGTRSGSLTITDSASGSPQTVTLSGAATAPGVALAPSSLTFGPVAVSQTSSALGVTITNSGTSTLQISSVTPTSGFGVVGSCATVAPGASCSLAVTFTPTAAGTATGTLTLTDDAGGGTQVVLLAGTGIAAGIAVTPANAAFAPTVVGSLSPARSVTITNTGTAALTAITASAQGDFQIANGCAATLAASASCTISVQYAPQVAGAESGTLLVSDSLGTQPVVLTGTGLAPGANLSAAALQFGGLLVNSNSPAQTLELTNSGNAALAVTSIAASAGFAETNNCGASLAAGASCGINVSFAPIATGAASGAITVTDAAGTQTAGLSGQGTAPGLAITPAFANFGAATVGATSAAQTLTVTNTGTAAVTLAAVAVTGDFSTVTTCSTSAALASGASCLVGVSFTPSATGLRTGGVSVSSAGGIMVSAVMVGTGTEPGISAAPAALAFGSQAVGVASAAQTVTVTNTGTAPLTVASITTSGDFAEADNCTATPLAAGASCVVNVTMSASTTGSRTGTLNIYDDADGLHPVALSGVGAAATVQLAPTQLAFGSQPIPGANIAVAGSPQTVVLTNSGNAALAIASIAASGAYTQTNTCGASLAANTSCTISVTFAPTLEGQQTGALVITDNASGSPSQSVALAGIGSPNGLVLAPPVLAFGGAAVGVTSAAQTATLSNNTGAAISSLAISASGELSETDTCGTSLATGASCTVNVTVTPVLPGAITGTISIGGAIAAVGGGAHRASRTGDPAPHAANPSRQMLAAVAISGGGSPAGLGLSPQTVAFAAQTVGVASAAQTLTLSNTGAAQVSGLTIASSPDFPYTTTCGATLAGNANCTINLTFKPTAAGARTGMLSMAASGGLSASVALSGQATGSTLAAAPSALTFAPLPPATASAPQTVTLTASGAAVNLQTIAVAGAGYALGASTCGTLPASLASGSSCTVQVIYTPAAIGTQAGTLTVTSDASNGAVVVGLSGSGSSASGSLTASPSTVTFAAQGVDHASSAQTVTLNNATGAAVPVAISVTGTNAADFSQTSTCGASLATGSSCTVAVVFTPAGAGARSATLVVAGTAGISVPLAGSGSDFSLTAANPAAITAGQTATVPLTLASLAGDSQTVTLACSVSGAGTGCTVAPASVALNGTTTAQASVLVTTTPPQFGQGETPLLPPAGLPSNGHGDLLWWLAAAALLGIAIRQRRRWKVMLAASAFAACVACGGISNQPISNGTGQSTLTVTVTATSSTGVVHTTTATVQVTARQ